MSKQSDKAQERVEFLAEVERALDNARAAASLAARDFELHAKKDPEGRIVDAIGHSIIVLNNPSPRLRERLKELGEIAKNSAGGWIVSREWGGTQQKSYQLSESACMAAAQVLSDAFPDDGSFSVSSHLT